MGAIALLLAACPGPRTCAAPVDVWGDTQRAPQLSILIRNLDGSFVEALEGSTATDLTFPVQGGHVLFVGARIRNLGACGDTISASLRNSVTQEVLAFETRSVDFTQGNSHGGTPDLSDTSNLANVPACPDASMRDVVDTDWLLEVTVTDKTKRSATATRHVLPRCSQKDPAERASCLCECRADYFLGKCGRGDGGGPDGG